MEPTSPRHVFVSYVREDKEAVDELQEAIEAAGLLVWRDVDRLWPGQDWRQKIREAIQTDSLAFVACFSHASDKRETSHQFEELTLAIEEYRRRPPNAEWLFPVRLGEVSIPPVKSQVVV